MSKHVRGVIIGVVAVVSMLGFASSALALTVSPSGAYTASSGTTTLTLGSTGQSLICTSSRIGATISSTGSGTSPTASALYNSCSNGILGAFTVTQTQPWPVRVVLSAVSGGVLVGLTVTVPLTNGRGGVLIRTNDGRCSFEVSGTVTVGRTYAQALPVAVATNHVFSVLSSALTALNVVGCSPFVVTNGLAATYLGDYTLSRAATVSG